MSTGVAGSSLNAPPQPRFLINGECTSRVDVSDRGFSVGDGLFETIAVGAAGPRFWADHCDRLLNGCRRLGLPEPDTGQLYRELQWAREGISHGTARLTVTRGPGPRGYAPPADPRPTRVIAFHPAAGGRDAPPKAFSLRWCDTRLALQPALAGIKHLNRLEQVMARAEWKDAAVQEGIMQATDGRVVECVMSNLFLVVDGRLVTPALDDCGVSGVMRLQVMRAAESLGIAVEVRRVEREEVDQAQAALVTNAVRGAVPVECIGERAYDAADPLLRQLRRHLESLDG